MFFLECGKAYVTYFSAFRPQQLSASYQFILLLEPRASYNLKRTPKLPLKKFFRTIINLTVSIINLKNIFETEKTNEIPFFLILNFENKTVRERLQKSKSEQLRLNPQAVGNLKS